MISLQNIRLEDIVFYTYCTYVVTCILTLICILIMADKYCQVQDSYLFLSSFGRGFTSSYSFSPWSAHLHIVQVNATSPLCPLTLSKDCYGTRVLPSHVFISSHHLPCALPFYHFSHLPFRSLSLSVSLYRSLSVSLVSEIHRHLKDGTRTHDTSQHYRHVRLWDPCCSRWGPRSCCVHQHQGWPRQMVGNRAEKWMSIKCMLLCSDGLSSWP